MAQTRLTRFDTVTYDEFPAQPPRDFTKFLSVLVDINNENLTQIEAALASLDARLTALGG